MPRSLLALTLSSALMVSLAAAQMPPIPATPLPSPAAPSALPEPAPVVPAPLAPLPVAPAAPLAAPAVQRSLTVAFEASFPAVIGGQKTSVPYRQLLVISPERLAAVRAKGGSQSLDADLDAFLKRLSTAPQDARFEEQADGTWAVVQRDGFTLDSAAAHAALNRAVANNEALVRLKPQTTTRPKRTLDYFVSRGITAFLAAGQTNYDGSSAARITNIHVGTRAFQDRLFEGSEFSFNRFLGPISARAGFVPGLVIAGERTASGLGGGICQVSTTVFRALYGAGLPITERRNHSYQVFYYQPQGLDATIYQPSQDLRFKNDSGGALWFQSEWDDKNALLVVRVFGKVRDFEVQVQAPRILSTTPAPPARFLPDASLKKGERKQIDWAAQGAEMTVDRLFVRAGQVFKKDTLRSSYRPWPNIFLVGR